MRSGTAAGRRSCRRDKRMGEKTLEIIQLNESHRDAVAPLIAGFRSTLLSYKGIQSEPDTKIRVDNEEFDY